MGIPIKTPDIRFLNYYLRFPDGDEWVDSTPIAHDLYFFLNNTTIRKHKHLKETLIKKGECHWRDRNKVEHIWKIEEKAKTRVWGTRK